MGEATRAIAMKCPECGSRMIRSGALPRYVDRKKVYAWVRKCTECGRRVTEPMKSLRKRLGVVKPNSKARGG